VCKKFPLPPRAFVPYLTIRFLLPFFFCSPKKRNKKRAPLRPNSVEKIAFAVYLERRKELHCMLSGHRYRRSRYKATLRDGYFFSPPGCGGQA
jgi:hypothetical protein